MATLYRKYRSQNFAEISGQNHIKITLAHEIETGRIAHAYLFCGPRGVGKTSLARVFAKAVNCQNRREGEHEPCNDCDLCREITAGASLDIVEIDAASHTGVDNVRENIIANARVAPSRCAYKLFIIDEVHMLSTSAFNALLKILEEPPANIIFILCTTEIHKVPLTIISRCQRFDFKRISVAEIVKKLQYICVQEDIRIDQPILENIARISEGHMRDAESLLGQVTAIGGKEITAEEADLVIPRSDIMEALKTIEFIANKDAGSAIALINKLSDEGVNLPRFTTDMIELLRRILLGKLSPGLSEKFGLSMGESVEIEVARVAAGLEPERILVVMDKLIAAKNELKGSFITQLPLEMAIAELCLKAAPARPASPAPSVQTPPAAAPQPAREPSAVDPKPPVAGVISKDAIISRWNEVLARVKKYNHSLTFILRVCEPRNLSGNKLCLAFRYKFHRDRISETNIKILVEKVLFEVFGRPIEVEAIIDEKITPPSAEAGSNGEAAGVAEPSAEIALEPAETTPLEETANSGDDLMVDNLLKTFGGKVVG